jgi:acetyltransferase
MFKYNLLIASSTKIGYGLFIGHPSGIIVNHTAVIGNNVNLSQFTTIGSNENRAAVIGDNVYIGPSVCLIENVHIGNNATIGAGSIVTKDVLENTVVAGNPAKEITAKVNPGGYIRNKYRYI